MSFLQSLRRRVEMRAAYHRTRRELRAMPLDVARDLDIDPSKADRLARRAVYGA